MRVKRGEEDTPMMMDNHCFMPMERAITKIASVALALDFTISASSTPLLTYFIPYVNRR